MPDSETACLEAAVHAFEFVYQKEEEDTLALLKLLIELNYRLNQFNRVLEYAASMAKSGHDERLRLQQQATDSSLGADERSRLSVRINKITATLQLAGEIRQEAMARQAKAEAGS